MVKEPTKVNIEFMIRRNLPEVLVIESENSDFPWSEKNFIKEIRKRRGFGKIVEYENKLVGFMIYYLNKNNISLKNIGIAKDY